MLPRAMCSSIATFIRYGWASCSIDAPTIAASASSTCGQYGTQVASSRRIRRAS